MNEIENKYLQQIIVGQLLLSSYDRVVIVGSLVEYKELIGPIKESLSIIGLHPSNNNIKTIRYDEVNSEIIFKRNIRYVCGLAPSLLIDLNQTHNDESNQIVGAMTRTKIVRKYYE